MKIRHFLGISCDEDRILCQLLEELTDRLNPEISKRYSQYNTYICFTVSEESIYPDDPDFAAEYERDDRKFLVVNTKFCSEKYKKLHKLEKRYELGKDFLQWLDKTFESPVFKSEYPSFDKDEFMSFIIDFGRKNEIKIDSQFEDGHDWGKEYAWFIDEVDYSLDLDK